MAWFTEKIMLFCISSNIRKYEVRPIFCFMASTTENSSEVSGEKIEFRRVSDARNHNIPNVDYLRKQIIKEFGTL